MKKLLLTTIIAGALVGSAFAQGTISLGGTIWYSNDGLASTAKVPAGTVAQVGTWGSLNVTVFYAPAGTPSPFSATAAAAIPTSSPWKQATSLAQRIGPLAGSLAATTMSLGDTATESVFVVGWAGSATTWNQAVAGGATMWGWSGQTLSKGGLQWDQAVTVPVGTNPPGTPTAIATGANAFSGLVLMPIPEPTMFALAGLGVATLLVFRRRK